MARHCAHSQRQSSPARRIRLGGCAQTFCHRCGVALAAGAFATTPEQAAGVIGLSAMDDGAAVRIVDQWLVLTTDSHVIHPIFFPGGDIGRLAVSGTVNDLAMMGATEVLGLTCSVIIEEGFAARDLERILASMHQACEEAHARVITGDTKVMGKGEIDGI